MYKATLDIMTDNNSRCCCLSIFSRREQSPPIPPPEFKKDVSYMTRGDPPVYVDEEKIIAENDIQDIRWLYSGRTEGWWYFDPKLSKDIEDVFESGDDEMVVEIFERNYNINFKDMTQNHQDKFRKIMRVSKNDARSMFIKGIAGVSFSK